MSDIIQVFMNTTPLEWAANIMTAVCIFLAGRNNVHTWWTGIVATILFGVLFFQYKLYADVTLQVFFVATGFIGWWNWIKYRTKPAAPIAHVPMKDFVKYMIVAAGVYVVYTTFLIHYTDAAAPLFDTIVLVLSVVAQILLVKRYIENWMVWLVVNTVAVPLFASRGLYVTSLMYALFWINAVYSYYHWHKLMKAQEAQ